MGPDGKGKFKQVKVIDFQENMIDIKTADKGKSICLRIEHDLKLDQKLKKGLYLIEVSNDKDQDYLESLSCQTFEAEVKVTHNSTTIQKGYQPIIHCGGIRQSGKAVDVQNSDGSSLLRNGDIGKITF